MTPNLDLKATEAKARDLIDSRIASIRDLVTKRQAVLDLLDQLTAAETADAKAYRAALSDGWKDDELRKLGLDEPAKMARKPRARRTTKTSRPTSSDPSPDAAGDPQETPATS